MQIRRHQSSVHGRFMGVAMICALALVSGSFGLVESLYGGVLPQDGDARYELIFWESIRDSDRPEDYEAYLKAFPEGRFAPLAKARAVYLRKAAVKSVSPGAPKIEEVEAVYEAVKTANLREGPSAKTRIVGSLNKGDTVLVTGRVVDRNWYRIETNTGLSGFVYGGLIRHSPEGSVASEAAPKQPAGAKPRQDTKTVKAVARREPAAPKAPAVQIREFKDCPECPLMISLPGGRFVMGDARGDRTESPAHAVSISKSFAIGKHEVTVGQWNACVLDGGCGYSPQAAVTDPEAPVRDLSWGDARQYVKWLSAKTGKTYRLPTEAEWEYAARGGTKTRYWWGNKLVKGKANCKDCGGDYDRSAPAKVNSFGPNPFGLHETNGGVWEWVLDCWHKNYQGAPKDGSARGQDNCRERVLRGGSWRNDSSYIHSASRFKYDADVRYLTNGFRVVKAQE